MQIGSLFAIWSLTAIVLEVPTGILADLYSRRSILISAQIIRAIGYGFWLISDGYWGFATGFILWGLSSTLTSGTFEAFVFDELKDAGKEGAFERVNGRISGYHFIGMTLGTLFGGLIAEFGFVYVLIPSVIAPIFSAFCIMMTRPVRSNQSTEERQYWHVLRDALREARHNPPLLRLIAVIVLAFGALSAADEFWGLYFDETGFSLTMIGVIFGIANIISSIAGFTAHRLRLPGRLLPAYLLLGGLLTLLIALLNAPLGILLILVMIFIVESSKVKYEVRLQHSISSHQRATVSSINNLLLNGTAFLFYLAIGSVAGMWGYVSFLWLLGFIIGVVSLIAIVWPIKRLSV